MLKCNFNKVANSLLQKEKRRSAKSEVSKVLFPDIGKITNLVTGVMSSACENGYFKIVIYNVNVFCYELWRYVIIKKKTNGQKIIKCLIWSTFL